MNELGWDTVTGLSLYACRYQLDGDVFLTNGSSDEAWGTGGRDADDYDVTLTEGTPSGHYVGHFDASGNIAAGVYRVTIYERATGVPLDSDTPIANGIMYWDGSSEINLTIIDTVVDSVKTETDKLNNMITVQSAGNEFTTAALVNAPTAEMDASELEAAMKAITGITVGGTWTWEKILKLTTAWIAGDWRVKSTDSDVQQLLDAEDGSTVILEQSLTRNPTSGNKYRDITVLI